MNESVKINTWIIICLLVITPLVIGILTFHAYGESVDESRLRSYSDYSLNAYHGLLAGSVNPDLGKGNYRYYGPAFLMAANLFVRLLSFVTNNTIGPDAWHLANFLAFYLCAITLYLLAKRWFSRFAALTTSLLFLCQPLLWGQAFINPKDIPFMTFFLSSILIGLYMRDKLTPIAPTWNYPIFGQIKEGWFEAKSSDQKLVVLSLLFALALPAVFWGIRDWLVQIISNWIEIFFLGKPDSVFGSLFAFFAENYRATPVESYALKSLNILFILLEIVVVFFTSWFLLRIFRNISFHLNAGAFLRFLRQTLGYLGNPTVLLAGLVLGLTISVRVLGPLAGLIVFATSINKNRQKVWPVFFSYFIIAAIVTYITWPYLWPDPIGRFKTSLLIMSKFPWYGKVLFDGKYYSSDQLPLSYIPLLFGIQFTEPVVILFIVGLGLFVFQIWNRCVDFDFAAIVLLWGVFPIIGFTIFRLSLYDNFRQLLFIVPPLFLLVGLAFEKIFQKIGKLYLQISVMCLFLLAGIYPIIHLNPYQYVYYNSFVGGLPGAYRRFESDYLATSSREAIEYINDNASEAAHVMIYTAGDNADMVVRYARPDLLVDFYNKTRFDHQIGYDYVIISTRGERDLNNYVNWRTVYSVERDGNVFVVVKQSP